jgi:glycerate-2-kinase
MPRGCVVRLRIQNFETLVSHGNIDGRKAVLGILEAGLEAADPYENTRKLLRLENENLVIGNTAYEPVGTPRTGDEVYDLSKIGNIYVFGAGKGCQRVAKAIEDVLGDVLTGGHVIDKKSHDVILKRIGVTLGSHPVPDEDCVRGCERILEMTAGLTENDLIFTIAGNGVSSLLTMPVPSVSIEEVRETTYIMQIERGAPTGDLNPIRNHLDMMKGGRITQHIYPAKMIHIIAIPPGNFRQLMNRNLWLHTLPDFTTFQLAVNNLKKWDAWNAVPPSVRKHLKAADPKHETVKAKAFEKMNFRIFGVMPRHMGMIPAAMKKAEELGYTPVILAQGLRGEASQVGIVVATIARTIEMTDQPLKTPCALFTSGELLVTVGQEKGIGGRNQEFILSAAQRIGGSERIVMVAADSDGTDGPGTQFVEEGIGIPCLGGGIVDGETIKEAESAGIDIREELKRHNATIPLWNLKSGIVISKSISINDLSVTLINKPG